MISVSDYYKSLFGQKVYKIALDAGCTCPNRDGTLGYGGCIFCNQSGSGDFIPERNLPIERQIENAKTIVNSKFSRKAARGETVNKKYIVYFQNFTNTYGDQDRLCSLFKKAASFPDIVGIAIGTRPDCLSEKMLSFLGELSRKTFMQVELGFQTANEKTAQYCRRGFTNNIYIDAVNRLHKASEGRIHVVTHIIFGLPGDSADDMMATVKTAVNSRTDGIKITVLYVVEGTDLATEYRAGKLKILEKDEYFELLQKAVKQLPENMVIHRLTGDPPKRILIAPEWTANKRQVMNEIRNIIKASENPIPN